MYREPFCSVEDYDHVEAIQEASRLNPPTGDHCLGKNENALLTWRPRALHMVVGLVRCGCLRPSGRLGPLQRAECVVTQLLEKRAPPLPCACEPRVDGGTSNFCVATGTVTVNETLVSPDKERLDNEAKK